MSRFFSGLLAWAVLAGTTCVVAADDDAAKTDAKKKDERKVFISPDDAGDDYPLQGEYSGTIKAGSGEMQLGVQVIALGNATFRAVAILAGCRVMAGKKNF
jgi:hypothetical protein